LSEQSYTVIHAIADGNYQTRTREKTLEISSMVLRAPSPNSPFPTKAQQRMWLTEIHDKQKICRYEKPILQEHLSNRKSCGLSAKKGVAVKTTRLV